MGGGFPVRDRARDNNHRREITMLIFVAPQGVVWWGYRSLEDPHITRGLGWLTVINDHKSGPWPAPLSTFQIIQSLNLWRKNYLTIAIIQLFLFSLHL